MSKNLKRFIVIAVIAFFLANVWMGAYVIQAIGRIHFGGHYSGGHYNFDIHEDHLARRIAEEFAAEQNKLFLDVRTDIGLDPESLELELTVLAMPREFSRGTTAMLTMQDESVPMELHSGMLRGSIAATPNGTRFFDYHITLDTDGVYRNNQFSSWMGDMPSISGVFANASAEIVRMTDHSVDMHMSFDFTQQQLFGDSVVSARLLAEDNGQEVASVAIQPSPSMQSHTLNVPHSAVMLYGEMIGESGLTYRYTIRNYSISASGAFDIAFMFEDDGSMPLLRITNADGKSIEF